jgi:hypothetical protein
VTVYKTFDACHGSAPIKARRAAFRQKRARHTKNAAGGEVKPMSERTLYHWPSLVLCPFCERLIKRYAAGHHTRATKTSSAQHRPGAQSSCRGDFDFWDALLPCNYKRHQRQLVRCGVSGSPGVFVQTRIGNRPVVWLRYVERRWTEGRTSGLGPRWIYRRTRTERDQVFNVR